MARVRVESTPYSDALYVALADRVETAGRPQGTTPLSPQAWVDALFQGNRASNTDIARALTDAPKGSKTWSNQMRTVQRWRDAATGRGDPKLARHPGKAAIAKLQGSSAIARLAGLPQSVRISGTIELLYNGVSQGTRRVNETISPDELRAARDAAGGDQVSYGYHVAQLVLEHYGSGAFGPEHFELGADSSLTIEGA